MNKEEILNEEILSIAADSRVVAMCGISGSGKTTVARVFEERGYVRLSADRLVWDKYGSSLALMTQAEQKEAFMSCNTELDSMLATLIDEGGRVVVDSTMCKAFRRDTLRRICRERGVEPVIIWLDVPLSVLEQRIAGRRGSGPDDQIVEPERLRAFFAGFERPAGGETDVVTIRASETIF